MDRSTKEAWLTGPGDLSEAVVDDVPAKGMTVKVRELSAGFSSLVGQEAVRVEIDNRGNQVLRTDHARLEVLTFVHGCIEPTFTEAEAEAISKRYRRAFEKVVEKIQELTNINPEEIKEVEARFQPVAADTGGPDVVDPPGPAAGVNGSAEPVRAGVGVPNAA